MIFLDEVVDLFLIRCSNNSLGCDECYRTGEIDKHEEESFIRKVCCIVSGEKNVVPSCSNDHFNNNHTKDKAHKTKLF